MRLSESLGLIRSLIVYWRPGRQRGLRRLYARLVGPGDLVFDVGAHLGDRTAAFAGLGAHVVAFEPQPHVARWLLRLVGGNERVTVRNEALGPAPGTARLAVSRRTPTVSTLSDSWRARIGASNPGFRSVRWEHSIEVPVVTLDSLIERYGTPRFCKIDVEGYEAEVLAGLTQPIPGLSIEFVSGHLEAAAVCIERLQELGEYRFNVVLGERRKFLFEEWQGPEDVWAWLAAGAAGASSGDIYATLEPALGVGEAIEVPSSVEEVSDDA